jgi:hypothetical protein
MHYPLPQAYRHLDEIWKTNKFNDWIRKVMLLFKVDMVTYKEYETTIKNMLKKYNQLLNLTDCKINIQNHHFYLY